VFKRSENEDVPFQHKKQLFCPVTDVGWTASLLHRNQFKFRTWPPLANLLRSHFSPDINAGRNRKLVADVQTVQTVL